MLPPGVILRGGNQTFPEGGSAGLPVEPIRQMRPLPDQTFVADIDDGRIVDRLWPCRPDEIALGRSKGVSDGRHRGSVAVCQAYQGAELTRTTDGIGQRGAIDQRPKDGFYNRFLFFLPEPPSLLPHARRAHPVGSRCAHIRPRSAQRFRHPLCLQTCHRRLSTWCRGAPTGRHGATAAATVAASSSLSDGAEHAKSLSSGSTSAGSRDSV